MISNGLFGGSISSSGVATDSGGNMYAGVGGGRLNPTDSGGIRIYAPPFSSASVPNVPTSVTAFTLAIGK